jgi:hypothetical protein
MSKIFFTFVFFAFFAATSFAQDNQMASVDHKSGKRSSVSTATEEIQMLTLQRNSYDAGASMWMQLCVARLLDQPKGGVSIKVYFSENSQFDFSDTQLENFILEKAETDTKGCLPLEVQLPTDIATGRYHIIVVAQTEEGVLLSRTCATTVWIAGE